MALVVPSSKLSIAPERTYARGYPILSGETADDLTLGLRGLTQQINYRYALGRCLFALDNWSAAGTLDFGAYFLQTGETSYTVATGEITVYLGADIPGLTLIADLRNLDVRMQISGGSASTGAGDSARATVTDTLAVTGPQEMTIEARRNTVSGTPSRLFSVAVYETTMVAGDFP